MCVYMSFPATGKSKVKYYYYAKIKKLMVAVNIVLLTKSHSVFSWTQSQLGTNNK